MHIVKDGLLNVPERFRDGLARYAKDHIEPGSALRCALEDKLGETLARMDRDLTLEDLRALTMFFHNELLYGTALYGSPAKVKTWLAMDRATCLHCTNPTNWYETQPAEAR